MAAIVEACGFHGWNAGNFIPSLLAVSDAVREQLGMDSILVFPGEVRERPWVEVVRSRGYEPHFVGHGQNMLADARALHGIVAKARPRLICTHFTRFDVSAALVGRLLGARVVWNVHTSSGVLEDSWTRRLSDLLKIRLLGRAACDRVVAVSEEVRHELRMRGHSAHKVTVVLNGIELSRFDVLPSRAAARTALRLGPDERVVLGFCWAPLVKGADVIADGCARIGATALLVGRDELTAFLSPVPDHVRVVPPHDDPAWLFAAADVFVSASRHEGFPYAIGEAMAAGLPVASSRIPGPAAYFDAPGLETFPSEDVTGLAAALTDLLDPAQRDGRGSANQAFVAERFGLDRHVDAVLEVMRQELAR
jgi:glycosyltransferase involved in cell wall biosynthesis